MRDIVTEAARLRREHGGPDFLTLYSFSLENWKRPMDEVAFLMQMYVDYLQQELPTMMENNIRFRQIGRLDNLPDTCDRSGDEYARKNQKQRRPDAGAGDELQQPGGNYRCRARHRPCR